MGNDNHIDTVTLTSLFEKLGSLAASNDAILRNIGDVQKKLDHNYLSHEKRMDEIEKKFMPREEILSRFREARASIILASISFLMSILETLHWLGVIK